mmetsp:Transcript_4909/g.10405  ORF Transcript_4909/g.10405 Transcript_4909/m.10405 type:complete len:219 (-) Transcript_4909:598-1254(-)
MSFCTSTIFSSGFGKKRADLAPPSVIISAVTSLSSPVLFERTDTAVSVSISTASTLPLPRVSSVGPRKTVATPLTTRMFPVALSKILTYWNTLRLMAVSTPSSFRMDSVAVRKTICSPFSTRIAPLAWSISRTYCMELSEIAVLTPPSTSHVGSGTSSAGPRCTHRLPLALSCSLTCCDCVSESAVRISEHSSYAPGTKTLGPRSMRFSPVRLSRTTQ